MNATAVITKTQHALTFNAHEVKTITRDGQVWMSSAELGTALEYAIPDQAVTKIYNRNAEEFTATMTKIIKVATAGGKQAIRFFSLRGAHLVAMFARTPVAKAFRVWVLDILDREVGNLRMEAKSVYRINEGERDMIEALCSHMEFVHSWFKRIYPAIKLLSPRLAASVYDHFTHGTMNARSIVSRFGLQSRQRYVEGYPWDGSWSDVEDHRRRMGRAG